MDANDKGLGVVIRVDALDQKDPVARDFRVEHGLLKGLLNLGLDVLHLELVREHLLAIEFQTQHPRVEPRHTTLAHGEVGARVLRRDLQCAFSRQD